MIKGDDDGGWSQGSPAKGSGWNNKSKNHGVGVSSRDLKTGREWGGSPEVESAAVWTMAEHKHQGSAGGSSGDGDGWNTFSPGQSNCSRHSQPDNWMSDEGSLSLGENACSPQISSSASPPNDNWAMSDGTQELEPIEDELDKELANEPDDPDGLADSSRDTDSVHFQIGGSLSGKEKGDGSSCDELESTYVPDSDRDTLVRGDSSSKLAPDNRSDRTSNMTTSPSPTADMNKAGEPSSLVSDDSSALPVHPPSSGTDDVGTSVWKSRTNVGSTSSINSIGSSSSLKSEGKNGPHNKSASFSPRKSNRYMYVHTCTCIRRAVHLHVHVLMCTVYMYLHMYICMYMYIHCTLGCIVHCAVLHSCYSYVHVHVYVHVGVCTGMWVIMVFGREMESA